MLTNLAVLIVFCFRQGYHTALTYSSIDLMIEKCAIYYNSCGYSLAFVLNKQSTLFALPVI